MSPWKDRVYAGPSRYLNSSICSELSGTCCLVEIIEGISADTVLVYQCVARNEGIAVRCCPRKDCLDTFKAHSTRWDDGGREVCT